MVVDAEARVARRVSVADRPLLVVEPLPLVELLRADGERVGVAVGPRARDRDVSAQEGDAREPAATRAVARRGAYSVSSPIIIVTQWSMKTPAKMLCSRIPMAMAMASAMIEAEALYSIQRQYANPSSCDHSTV